MILYSKDVVYYSYYGIYRNIIGISYAICIYATHHSNGPTRGEYLLCLTDIVYLYIILFIRFKIM